MPLYSWEFASRARHGGGPGASAPPLTAPIDEQYSWSPPLLAAALSAAFSLHGSRLDAGDLLVFGGGSAITPSVYVEYIDTSGVRQKTTIANDGSTTITVNQYAGMFIDGTGTRSATETTEWDAMSKMGFLFDNGRASGTSYVLDGTTLGSMDLHYSVPLWGDEIRHVGNLTKTLKFKDTVGNQRTVTYTVNSVDRSTTVTHIGTGAGSWPSWANGTTYTIDNGAGSAYEAFGDVDWSGKSGIRLIAVGAGGAPSITRWTAEGQSYTSSTAVTRAKDCVMVGVDIKTYGHSSCGIEYCGAINGRVRRVQFGVPGYDYTQPGANTATKRDNLKWARGLFFVNTGEMNEDADNTGYVFAPGDYVLRCSFFEGVQMRRTASAAGGGPLHVLRFRGERLRMTSCQIWSNTATSPFEYIKVQSGDVNSGTGQNDAWDPDDDRVGASDGSGKFMCDSSRMVFNKTLCGASSEVQPSGYMSSNPWTNGGANKSGVNWNVFEDCLGWGDPPSTVNSGPIEMAGGWQQTRGCRGGRGTGAYNPISTSPSAADNIPTGHVGPYVTRAAANDRPVPT